MVSFDTMMTPIFWDKRIVPPIMVSTIKVGMGRAKSAYL
eukprot:COSAG06_NODE_37234_length_437_cov_2.426036_1_plen_38_part_10